MVSFENPWQAVREIEWCAAHGLKGIGEIRPAATLLRDIEGLRPVIEALIETDLILSTHCSEPTGHLYPGKGDLTPEVLYPLIKAFPDLKLVCAHWGGGLPFYALMPEVKKALQNVYFDSAASPYLYSPQIYQRTAELCGEEHILFGSDYPLLKPQRLLREIDQLDLTGEYRQRLLSANAATLLKLPQA
jgi:predicted TIM-barrel fold metal-dependent hydrolase